MLESASPNGLMHACSAVSRQRMHVHVHVHVHACLHMARG
jgi:hypothetical protein